MARKRRRDAELAQFDNRKSVLRARRDREEAQQANRMLLALTIGLGVFLAFGMFRELYQVPNTPVAKVNGENITAATYIKRLTYARQQLIVTLQNFRDLASSSSGDFLKNFADQSRARLPETTLDQLVNEALIRQEAIKRGVKVTDEDGDKRINDDLATAIAPQPTVSPAESGEATATPAGSTEATSGTVASAVSSTVGAALASTAGLSATDSTTTGAAEAATALSQTAPASVSDTQANTSTAGAAAAPGDGRASSRAVTSTGAVTGTGALSATTSATPTVSAKAIESAYRSRVEPMLQTTGLTKSDYRSIILQVIYRDKLQEMLANEVPITDKQVEAEYVVFEQEDAAKTAISEMDKGTSWDALRTKYKKPAAAAETTPATGADDATSGSAPIAVTPVTSTSGVSRTYALDIGDRKWYTLDGVKSSWGAGDADAAKVMSLRATASLTEPVKGNQGYYVVRVFTVDPARALTEEELKTRKDGALDKWLEKVKTQVKIDRYPTDAFIPAEPDWFTSSFEAIASTTVPTIAVPPISETGAPPTSAAPADVPAGNQPTTQP